MAPSSERLLERIYKLEAKKTVGDDQDMVITSVVDHLQAMLNTKKGSVVIDPEYGLSDITSFSSENLAPMGERMAKEIEEFISKYEPRLKNVKVKFVMDKCSNLQLNFKIEGVLNVGRKMPVAFETWVDSTGKVRVVK